MPTVVSHLCSCLSGFIADFSLLLLYPIHFLTAVPTGPTEGITVPALVSVSVSDCCLVPDPVVVTVPVVDRGGAVSVSARSTEGAAVPVSVFKFLPVSIPVPTLAPDPASVTDPRKPPVPEPEANQDLINDCLKGH